MAFQTSMYITLFYTTVITQLAFLRSLANDAAATKWSMPRATKRRISEEDDNMIAYEVKSKEKTNTSIAYISAALFTSSYLQLGCQTFELSASTIS